MPRRKRPLTRDYVPDPQTYAEWFEYEYKQFESHRGHDHPPACNYTYRPGDAVQYGHAPDCRVEEVLRDGQLIHLSYHDKGERYGVPFDNKRRLPKLTWWNEVAPLSEMEDTHFARERIRADYSQTMLSSLVFTAYSRGLIDNPEYQRDYVWTLDDKCRLVHSIFDRCDIGKFLFVEHPHPEHRLEIVDGKQRLRAIMDFMEGRFAFQGKTWFQLSYRDKWAFGDIMVQSCKLDSEYVKKSDILWLFLSINRGGVPQTDEHIAKATKMYEDALLKEGATE